MGVELEIAAVWDKHHDVFARVDTHKMLSVCYDDFFELKGIKINELVSYSLDGGHISKMKDDNTYGSPLYKFKPQNVLTIIESHVEELKEGYDDWSDVRTQAAIGLLRGLVGIPEARIVLRWY